MRQLDRDYIFEFAGMPQSGKTSVRDILAHYLKRMEYPLVEFNGGSRYSRFPIYRMPIGDLNEELAYNIEGFVRSIGERQNPDHNIYLFDRGLIDRCIFTDALVRADKVSPKQAEKLDAMLTKPELLAKLDGVFIFVTSPETALDREYAGKLVKRQDVRSHGDVMNEHFLLEMRVAADEWYRRSLGLVRHIELKDTISRDTDMQKVARDVFGRIREWYPELELQLMSAG
jgi:hypothetical protein